MKNQSNFLKKHRAQGFTLIELLLVLVILAILAGIVLPKFAGKSKDAKITSAMTQIGSFKMALDNYEIDNGAYPKSGDLETLVNPPNNHQAYIDSIPADPWGNPYVYIYPGKHNANGYDLSSNGPDGPAGDGRRHYELGGCQINNANLLC